MLIIFFIMIFSFSAYGSNLNTTTALDNTPSIIIPSDDTTPTTDTKEENDMKTLELKINYQIVDVFWGDNS